MSALTFFHPVLEALGDGKVIRKSIALALRVIGALAAVRVLIFVVSALKQAFTPNAPVDLTLGALLLCLLVLAGTACVVQICFYRAGTVAGLGDSHYTVIPIVSILFRWAGEVWATLLVTFAVGGCLLIWIANTNPMWLLGNWPGMLMPSLPGVTSSFLTGMLWLLSLAVAAFVSLVLAYFLAESSLVMVDIAQNTRPVAARRPEVSAAAAAAAGSAAAPVPPAGAVLLCRACGAPLEPGSTFCGSCGSHS